MDERNRRYENAQLGAKEIVAKQGSRDRSCRLQAPEPETVEIVETGVDQRDACGRLRMRSQPCRAGSI